MHLKFSVNRDHAGQNCFSHSVGLIAITQDEKFVVIKKRFPYCIENYIVSRKINLEERGTDVVREFLYSHCSSFVDDDLKGYLNELAYEDEYDFPHGQINRYLQQKIDFNHYIIPRYKFQLFKIAKREFEEETGFTFDAPRTFATRLDSVLFEFVGLDGNRYVQYYFVIRDVSLRRSEVSRTLEKHLYRTHLLDVHSLAQILENQQAVKEDNKHRVMVHYFICDKGIYKV